MVPFRQAPLRRYPGGTGGLPRARAARRHGRAARVYLGARQLPRADERRGKRAQHGHVVAQLALEEGHPFLQGTVAMALGETEPFVVVAALLTTVFDNVLVDGRQADALNVLV